MPRSVGLEAWMTGENEGQGCCNVDMTRSQVVGEFVSHGLKLHTTWTKNSSSWWKMYRKLKREHDAADLESRRWTQIHVQQTQNQHEYEANLHRQRRHFTGRERLGLRSNAARQSPRQPSSEERKKNSRKHHRRQVSDCRDKQAAVSPSLCLYINYPSAEAKCMERAAGAGCCRLCYKSMTSTRLCPSQLG